MTIQRFSIEGKAGGPVWEEPDRDGDYVRWEEVAKLMVDISGLITRIEIAHDLHAVFTVKNSEEFKKVKSALVEVFKA
jgi:hypothetical protein